MFTRREFIKSTSAAAIGINLAQVAFGEQTAPVFESRRPPVDKRTFVSPGIEKKIVEIKPKLRIRNWRGSMKIASRIPWTRRSIMR
jgi:hypothetical protein